MLSLNLLSSARIPEKNKNENQMNTKIIKKMVPALSGASGVRWQRKAK